MSETENTAPEAEELRGAEKKKKEAFHQVAEALIHDFAFARPDIEFPNEKKKIRVRALRPPPFRLPDARRLTEGGTVEPWQVHGRRPPGRAPYADGGENLTLMARELDAIFAKIAKEAVAP